MSNTLESLKYSRNKLEVIDQLKLPGELVYIELKNSEDAWTVIRTMQVRGAPLIAIVAVLGIVIHVQNTRDNYTTTQSAVDFLLKQMEYLRTSRPTAVNLFVATDELKAIVEKAGKDAAATASSVIDAYITAAEKILVDDIATNKSIGDYGAKKIIEIVGKKKIRVLTICNTGSLATAGYGTALGVVRSLHAMGLLEQVYACETRPYNQGARLTAFEIVNDGLPGTLITDSMASYLMAVKGVDCVIVGADRVAANGDTANKIGTYQLAITANYHDVPFFTAVPTTTLDLSIPSGVKIHVEERPANELTSIFNHKIAPDGINVWNPSFDVTPCSLIRGIITEIGVAESSVGNGGIIDMAEFLKSKNYHHLCQTCVPPVEMPIGYQSYNEESIKVYLSSLSNIMDIIGGSITAIKEVGDGNLNFVYIVTGSNGKSVVAKQALPYVRCVGESWPLTLERAYFENYALIEERKYAAEFVPEVYHFDKSKSLMVMRFIEPPHLILRKKLMEGAKISTFASHVGQFAAKTLFHTSLLALSGGEFRTQVSNWSRNTAMCALTEQVIFTDPYTTAKFNHWTSPQLDTYAEGIRNDSELKLAALNLKEKFLTCTQALLHGDLHSGSVMVTEGSTFVIDPEFAFYGPMGFDLGAFLSNLFLNYFSNYSSSHSTTDAGATAVNGADYAEWILQQILVFYSTFTQDFLSLWNDSLKTKGNAGELFVNNTGCTGDALVATQKLYLDTLFFDALGFTGMKMIRRIVGIAHVADLESINDSDKRAVCEKRCLWFARALVIASQKSSKNATTLDSIEKVADYARSLYSSQSPDNWPATTA